MRGVFVDANESLAVIFEGLEKPGDPKVRIHRDPDITPEQYPEILGDAEIAIVDHTALPTDDREEMRRAEARGVPRHRRAQLHESGRARRDSASMCT